MYRAVRKSGISHCCPSRYRWPLAVYGLRDSYGQPDRRFLYRHSHRRTERLTTFVMAFVYGKCELTYCAQGNSPCVLLNLDELHALFIYDNQIDRAVRLRRVEDPIAKPEEMFGCYHLADIAVDVPAINHMSRCGSSQIFDQRGGLPGPPIDYRFSTIAWNYSETVLKIQQFYDWRLRLQVSNAAPSLRSTKIFRRETCCQTAIAHHSYSVIINKADFEEYCPRTNFCIEG